LEEQWKENKSEEIPNDFLSKHRTSNPP